MLSLMRSGTQSIVLKLVLFGLLLLATVGLALMDYQGMFRKATHSNKVADSKCATISTVEFDHLLQGALRRQNMKQEEAYRTGYPEVFLQQEMNSRILTCAVRDLGLYVDDVTAAKELKKMLAGFTKQGLTEQEALQRFLYSLGINESKLVESLKAQIGVEMLMQALSAGATAPQQMVEDATKYRYESRRAEYITLTADDAKKAPSDDELKKYYTTIADRFMVPETRNLAVLVIDRKAMGGQKAVTPEMLKDWYDTHQSEYATPEKRVISQAVAKDEASAKAIYDQASKSKDLKAAAKNGATYIKSAEYGSGDIAVEIADKTFAGKEGDVLEPIKTPLGWVIVHIEKVKPAATASFDSVKAQVEKDGAAGSDDSDALYAKANEIDDMVASGKSLAEIGQTLGLHEHLLDHVDAKGNGINGAKPDTAGIPEADKALASGFTLQKGAVSQLIETQSGEFLLVENRDIFPAAEQPLEKVRADVLKAWDKEQASTALDRQASKAMERLKMGESFDTVAASMNKKVERTEMTPRREKPDSKLPHGFVPALFSLDKVGEVTVLPQDGSAILIRLADRRLDVPQQQSKEDTEALRTMLNHSVQKDLLEQYRKSLMAKYKVTFDNQTLKDMYAAKAGEAEEDVQ